MDHHILQSLLQGCLKKDPKFLEALNLASPGLGFRV